MLLRPSERQAISWLERVILQSKAEGFAAALALVEQQIYSVDTLDELLAWLNASNREAGRQTADA